MPQWAFLTLKQMLPVGLPPLVATLVFGVIYFQNRTVVTRSDDFLLISEDRLAVRYKAYHSGEEHPEQKLKEFIGPIRQIRVAKKRVYHRCAGFRFFERGHNVSFNAPLPEFLIDSPFLRQLGQQLCREYKTEALEFTSLDWSLVRNGFREPESFLRDWDGSIDVEMVHVSPKAASLVETHYEYTGGAHGNFALIGRSFVEEKESIRELKLADLFDPASDWEQQLVKHVLTDLRKQGATWIMEDPFDSQLSERFSQDDLSQFTLSAVGIRFYFSPYHVGSYADGVFTVLIPYSMISECFSTDSPAKQFVDLEIDSHINEWN